MQTNRVCKTKHLDEYYDLFVQKDTLMLRDVFRSMCLEIYGFDPSHFISAPVLAWQAALKKIKVKLDLLTDNDMLLMPQKDIIRLSLLIIMRKLITNTWKNHHIVSARM